MATYVIGDVHGCFAQLQQLLQKIRFDLASDTLWFTGDLVNRGPNSLQTLRFIKNLGTRHRVVLGNHDIFLLCVYERTERIAEDHALQQVLTAQDCPELMAWLTEQPLMHYDPIFNIALVHAGIAPQWTLEEALRYSEEVHQQLIGVQRVDLLNTIFGNMPALWCNTLTGWDRARCIVNYFTRMRLCTSAGLLNLIDKEYPKADTAGTEFIPWFNIPQEAGTRYAVAFGHWAAHNEIMPRERIFSLDTGCVWGRYLTALRLDDKQIFQVSGWQ